MSKNKQIRRQAQDDHNHRSLAELLDHIDQQCRVEREQRTREAEQEAEGLRRAARRKAAELLWRVRRRERAVARERIEAETARAKSQLRRAWLQQRRELAEYGMQTLREKLGRHWERDVEARRRWLARALADAAVVLPLATPWTLHHPPGWRRDECESDGAQIKTWQSEETLQCGFRIVAGNAMLDSTPDGLLARRDRVAGLLLAELQETPPELES